MKKAILIFSFAFATVLSTTVRAGEITTLPMVWTGVAGDLVTRVPASLTLKVVTSSNGKPSRESGRYEYSAQGQFQFGDRVVPVYKVLATSELSSLRKLEGTELAIFTRDELVPIVFVMIGLSESKEEYLMRDLESPPNGRKLILRAKLN